MRVRQRIPAQVRPRRSRRQAHLVRVPCERDGAELGRELAVERRVWQDNVKLEVLALVDEPFWPDELCMRELLLEVLQYLESEKAGQQDR